MQKKTAHCTSAPGVIDTLESRTLFSVGAGPAFHADVVTPKTTTAIIAAPHVAKLGQSVTVTVIVSAARRFGAPAGTVEFMDGGNLIQVAGAPLILTLSAKGRASYTFGAGNFAFYEGKHHLAAEFISSNSLPDSTSRPTAVNVTMPKVKTGSDGLGVASVKPGHGKGIEAGQTATILYTGFLFSTGTLYTYSAANPPGTFSFIVEDSPEEIFPGIDEGTSGMKVGETRALFIPAALAYGDKAEPPSVPANSELVFLVKLASIS